MTATCLFVGGVFLIVLLACFGVLAKIERHLVAILDALRVLAVIGHRTAETNHVIATAVMTPAPARPVAPVMVPCDETHKH